MDSHTFTIFITKQSKERHSRCHSCRTNHKQWLKFKGKRKESNREHTRQHGVGCGGEDMEIGEFWF